VDPAATTRPGRLGAAGAWIRERYCTVDTRTLGLFRLILGFLLTADWLRHWGEAATYYCNEGVLSNHFHLFRPSSGYNFSVLHAFSTLPEVHVAFALGLVCFVCFWAGYRTRLFSILSFVLVTSRDNRLVMIENGGYVVVNLLACWAMFMPTGARFSVDAWLRSLRERRERSIAALADRPAGDTPYVSGVALLVTVNVAFVYFFNVVNKSGQIWRTGDTVHYVLHLDRMITGIPVFFREVLPLWATRGLSFGVLALEALLFAWILWPYGRRVTRPLAMGGMWILHGTFGIMMRLGPFSWFMIAWSFLLLLPEHWEALLARSRRGKRALLVAVDERSPLAFAIARALARLDAHGLLAFSAAPERLPLFAVRDETGSLVASGERALRVMTDALPLGAVLSPALSPLVRLAVRREAEIGRFFGLRAPEAAAPPRRRAPESAVARRLGRFRAIAREVVIAYLGLCAVWQALQENKSVPQPVKDHLRPPYLPAPIHAAMAATIQYPRLFQGWGMFSPNPISEDGSVSIDAYTVDGRRIDPFTGQEPDLVLTDARGLGLSQIRQDYWNRIRLDRNKPYRDGLRDYLLRWHQITGRPEDELVAFDVYWVRDKCPKPGDSEPYDNQTIALLTYRKPGYKPPPGAPAIPPAPKVESAGD
jgi:hypothetical protein